MALTCDMCGKKSAVVKHVTRSMGRGKDAFLVEGVPLVSCSACGESYLTAETLKELERIRLHRRHFGVRRQILVTRFGGAA
jgi:YgiT-type zinc finger domain-containing protein